MSAGRVQSVAVRLISEREHERLKFKRTNYWGVVGKNKKSNVEFETRLFSYDGKRVALGRDFDSDTGELLADKKEE